MRSRFALFVAVAAVAIAGCSGASDGGDPTPNATARTSDVATTSPASSTSASPTPTPTTPSVATTGPNVKPGEKPPVPPPQASQDSYLGASLFAVYWVETWDWAYATNDASLLRAASGPSCTDCNLVVGIFTDSARKHQSFRGGRLHVTAAKRAPSNGRKGAQWAVDVSLFQDPLKVVDAAGKVVGSYKRASNKFRFFLKRSGSSWLVVEKAHF